MPTREKGARGGGGKRAKRKSRTERFSKYPPTAQEEKGPGGKKRIPSDVKSDLRRKRGLEKKER